MKTMRVRTNATKSGDVAGDESVGSKSEHELFKDRLREKMLSAEGALADQNEAIADRLSGCFHALLWLGGAVFIWKYCDVWHTLTSDTKVIRPVFYFGLAFMALMIGIATYLTHVLPRIDPEAAKDYTNKCPKLSNTAGGSAIVMYFCFVFSLWPVWGVFSFIVVTVSLVAAAFFGNLLPPYW
eukprot:TRINITY_DN4766_c0_g1_i1.p1 TRINITY_DN4766_c0_g1~~TRINITY_DN4766_c0_g1_i1.p1  ORF type:complete len:183 (+),score=57.13 TRINITY_DN4766_c0_g1_i1:400-948(+)